MPSQAGQNQWNPISEVVSEGPSEDDFFNDRMDILGKQDLGEAQKSARDGLYGEFTFNLDNANTEGREGIQGIPNAQEGPIINSPDYQVNLSETLPSSVDEGPLSPIVQHMAHAGLYPLATAQVLKESLKAGQNPEDAAKNAGLIEEEQIQFTQSVDFLNDPKEIPKREAELLKDFGTELQEFQSQEGEWIGFGEEAFTLVSQNYIVTGSENQDKAQTLNIALETAANKVIDNKVIKRTESFKKIFERIKNNDLSFSERFFALQGILKITNQDQGVKGRKKLVEYQRMKQKRDIASLEKDIQNLQYEIDRAEYEKNSEKVQKLKREQLEVREQLKDVTEQGDAGMGGGKADVISEIKLNVKETA